MRTSSGLSVEFMGSMSQDKRFSAFAVTGVFVCILSVGACTISTPAARADEPGRVKSTGYPAVQDVPARPDKPAMTAEEQLKLKRELGAARDRQAPKGKSSSTNAAKP